MWYNMVNCVAIVQKKYRHYLVLARVDIVSSCNIYIYIYIYTYTYIHIYIYIICIYIYISWKSPSWWFFFSCGKPYFARHCVVFFNTAMNSDVAFRCLRWGLLYLIFLLSQPIFPDKIAGCLGESKMRANWLNQSWSTCKPTKDCHRSWMLSRFVY